MESFKMIWIVDIIAIVIMLAMLFKDTRKGFVKSVFGLLISLVSIAVAFLCADIVIEATDGAFGLQEAITNALSSTFADWGLAFDVSQEGIREKLTSIEFFKTLPFLVDLVMEQINTGLPAGTMLNVHLGQTVGVLATNIVVGIVLFILCKIVLTFIEKLLSSLVESITLLGALNTLLGAAVGFVKGAITVSLLCMLLSTVPVFSSLMEQMPDTLFVYEWFFVNNPITKILAEFI
ncbi:MAG: CvpA family protein [Clostridia bacterium]|nr:CvpA family protein [Clostridia bacterium]